MKRVQVAPRTDWVQKAEDVGFTYHTLGMAPGDVEGVYWDESTAYEFSMDEIETIEAATEELHDRCIDAVAHVVAHPELMDRFAIPQHYRDYIIRSWNARDPFVMGRFDLAYDPKTPTLSAPKMLEYNADTPTLVIETAVVQWFWLQDMFPQLDQFNSLHEKLIERYRLIASLMPVGSKMVFSSLPLEPTADYPNYSAEEFNHVQYFMDLAKQAGINVDYCAIADVGWDSGNCRFVDLDGQTIDFWSKLYPWEWLAQEPFGVNIPGSNMGVVEPVWKMLLSNKAILPLLWEMFPGHPNLLPAYWDKEHLPNGYVAKPILAREGANIEMVVPGKASLRTEGSYGANPIIYQEAVNLPAFDGQYVVLGSWVVGDKAAGMIVRESESPIVVNTSKVVPHYIRET